MTYESSVGDHCRWSASSVAVVIVLAVCESSCFDALALCFFLNNPPSRGIVRELANGEQEALGVFGSA